VPSRQFACKSPGALSTLFNEQTTALFLWSLNGNTVLAAIQRHVVLAILLLS